MNKKELPGKLLLSEDDIQKRIPELAEEIERYYKGKEIVLIGVLRGAFLFMADLIRHLKLPIRVDFMAVTSYGSDTKSSGVVRILKDLDMDIKSKNVLLVEDIIDTGLTLQYLIRNLKTREPESLNICTLLAKENKSRVDIEFTGFHIPRKYVVGYGLDYNEQFRNLRGIYLLDNESTED